MTAYAHVFEALEALVASSAVSDEVINILLPQGVPLEMEAQLWDYKRELPKPPLSSDTTAVAAHRAEIADLMKDAAALYNSYGGYLVFGVADKGKSRVIGCDDTLDAGDFNKRLEGATGVSIECLFGTLNISSDNTPKSVGVLLVPRRPDGQPPATFRKAASAHPSGKRAYAANDCLVRIRDESRPAAASSSDWTFLHGARRIAAPLKNSRDKPPMQVSMPARDPDLVRFIGRDDFLSQLRSWLGDPRSAVRLLTGIGGLGKTSIAYRFAEEVVDLRAGNVEKLVWLTAKKSTFSAVRGEMVETSRTDFSDARSLYEVLLADLGHDPLFDDGDPTNQELLEAIYEAMSCYNCLVVVDDIDSLSPEDQRDVVFSLSNVAARTVNGINTPSRVLFTSRIDIGLPPANVIKVSGLNRDEFREYILSVSSALGVPLQAGDVTQALYDATSGSPLFAASVLRLVKLGTPLSDSIARWRGEDGEDVRRFAFERELQRLTMAAGRLLYAICLLGRTTTVELASVLELSSVAVSSSIANLQSFHLVATSLGAQSGASISAPDDVTLTMDVLKKHLGSTASMVEAACSKARKAVASRRDEIAQSIGQIVGLWKEDDHKQALIVAEQLAEKNPENGDVSCLLGTALIKPGVEAWSRADVAFTRAAKLKCARPEMIEGWIRAKEHLEDWTGILNLTSNTISTRSGPDRVLGANIKATQELIKLSRIRGDRARRMELCRKAIININSRLSSGRSSYGEREEIIKHEFNLARMLLDDVAAAFPKAGDQIALFDTVAWLVDHGVFVSEFVTRGAHALTVWWSDVESRPYVDERAIGLLKRSVSRLSKIERVLEASGKPDVAGQIREVGVDLSYKAMKLIGDR